MMGTPRWEVKTSGDTCHVEFNYPDRNKNQYLEIGLCDVRGADGLRISYDFNRDGWVVKQASTFCWGDGEDGYPEWDENSDNNEDWQEVAFIQAWGRKKPSPHEMDS